MLMYPTLQYPFAPHLQDITRNQMDTIRGMSNLVEQGATNLKLQRKNIRLQGAMLGELEDQTGSGRNCNRST